MSSSAPGARKSALRDISTRAIRLPPNLTEDGKTIPTSEYFGINTYGARQMRDKLPKDVYASLVASIRHGKKLDLAIAPVVAQVIKEWAISRGVTHFTHLFQPQTGLTA